MEHKQIRSLSVAEYFQQVQKEYLMAEFRHKTYFSPKDRKYWGRVMEYKSKRINDIAERNGLNSILNNSEKLAEIKSMLFYANGKPKFTMSEDDDKNYFAIGSEFSYQGEIYTLDQVTVEGHLTLYSRQKEEFIDATKDEVCRIL